MFIRQDKVGTARMDLFFFVLFPILFTIFNVIYWIVFMYRWWDHDSQVTKTDHNQVFMFQSRCTGEKLDLLNLNILTTNVKSAHFFRGFK